MTKATTEKTTITSEITELKPYFAIPIVLVIIAIALLPFSKIGTGIVALLGLFLMIQTFRIKLQFTQKALDVYNGKTMIRSFPYEEWINWRIFWTRLPILFYFREVNSIHFLPVIFDPKTLLSCLEKYCPRV